MNRNPKIEDTNAKVEDKNPKVEEEILFFLQNFPKHVQNSKLFRDIYPEEMPKYLPLCCMPHAC